VVKESLGTPLMVTVFGMILLLSKRTGFILVEMYFFLRLEGEAGFIWEKPSRQSSATIKTKYILAEFNQFGF
jgi:hypothetical protein